ncbi:hypothetical protein T4B_5233 [Trichinella pseudospiralis]|uniref:Transmembrane protein n=1 Tax=Trichinella pseudospiralis TaxID=6337 RepID=A0A0V1IIM3_TRIPS|nr:hypothetical protein T4B_5233 [Trichinella pseudospiralis]
MALWPSGKASVSIIKIDVKQPCVNDFKFKSTVNNHKNMMNVKINSNVILIITTLLFFIIYHYHRMDASSECEERKIVIGLGGEEEEEEEEGIL